VSDLDKVATVLLERAARAKVLHPELRLGQALFDAAEDWDPRVHRLLGTAVDPFHHDSRIPAFLAALRLL
jgi:hypothetical protein